MANTTLKLRKALAKGAKIVCSFQPYEGEEMLYDPRTPRDPQPWRLKSTDLFRYRAGELRIEWGEGGEPVKLTDNQQGALRALVERGVYHAGCGWVWDNHSNTARLMDALVKKGVAELVEKPWSKTPVYEPTEKGRKHIAPRPLRPKQKDIDGALVLMAEQDGEWKPGDGWHYVNEYLTRLCLEALVSDGYVVKQGDSYGLKGSGFDRAHELGFDPSLLDEV